MLTRSRIHIIFIGILFLGIVSFNTPKKEDSKVNAIDRQVNALLAKMTIEEKVGQMTQINLDLICNGEIFKLVEPHQINTAKLNKALLDYKVGSILNCGGHSYTREHWHDFINQIQETAKTKTRLGIPILYGIDAIHGANYTIDATLFPQQLAQAATWNPELIEKITAATAYEVRASGIPWNFSPVLDLGRQPLWSRFFETYGEDVYLAKQMTAAAIKGYQGSSVSDKYRVAACMKHFLGYSYSLSGKDRTPAWIPERELRAYFLPTFKTAIDAGAKTIMINSGEINGIPVHANHDILTNLLRNELNFKGVAVTDWEDIIKLYKVHHVAASLKEAVKMAVLAGIDLSMVPNDFEFTELLLQLVKEKQIPETRIDESVRRILTLKYTLGLFENATANLKDYPDFGSEKYRKISEETASESITLLKNERQTLPLSRSKKVLICGPAANSLNILNGAWTNTWQGVDTTFNPSSKSTILKSIIAKIGPSNVTYSKGSALDKELNIEQTVESAKNSECIIVCLGEIPCTEKPGDIDDLSLPEAQLNLVKALAKVGKPIILVLVENRPRLIREIENLAQSIVMAYLPSNEGANAITNILYGDVNPSGKLPFTYPKYSGSLMTYDHKYSEKLDKNFKEEAYQPQFPFGYGLSYSNFEYKNLSLSSEFMFPGDTITVQVDVINTSQISGKEVIQVYLSDLYASITPSVKKLIAFKKTSIAKESTISVAFKITLDDLKFIDQNNKSIAEAGEFEITVSNLKKKFILKNN